MLQAHLSNKLVLARNTPDRENQARISKALILLPIAEKYLNERSYFEYM
jgi:hypothetical protein